MKVNVVNMQGKKVRSLEVPEKIFKAPIHVSLMHQAYIRQMANARLGTHKTKGRSEVSGGGRKPWRQKGTGRARQGSTRAAQWVGGGKVHTPKPRSYEQAMPKKMRRAALRSALSVKASEKDIIFLDELTIPEEPKTQEMAKVIDALVGEASTLILIPMKSAEYDQVVRFVNNLAETKTLQANYLNIRDLLTYDKIILPVKALEILAGYLG
jgi:large subunit ribosomal protein L4